MATLLLAEIPIELILLLVAGIIAGINKLLEAAPEPPAADATAAPATRPRCGTLPAPSARRCACARRAEHRWLRHEPGMPWHIEDRILWRGVIGVRPTCSYDRASTGVFW